MPAKTLNGSWWNGERRCPSEMPVGTEQMANLSPSVFVGVTIFLDKCFEQRFRRGPNTYLVEGVLALAEQSHPVGIIRVNRPGRNRAKALVNFHYLDLKLIEVSHGVMPANT